MGYTNRKYPVMEIAVAAINRPDHQNERVIPGDIVAFRRPHFVIGTKEGSDFIWLLIDGLEENEWGNLISLGHDADVHSDIEDAGPVYDKRRYFIPLARLKKLRPDFNIQRAMDPGDFYQPFITIDFSDSGYWYYLANEKPLSIHGLIFDKVKGAYL
jgi:hypothetical protein